MNSSFRQYILGEDNTLPEFKIENKTFKFNQSKSNKEWIDRISSRTGYSKSEFIEIVNKGITRALKENKLCLRFMKSKFVLVINEPKGLIVTIRSSDWENLDNGKCNKQWVFEDYKNNQDLEYIVSNTDYDNEGYSINVTYQGETAILEFNDKCTCCFEVNL